MSARSRVLPTALSLDFRGRRPDRYVIDFSRNYFDLFGLAASFRFDLAALDCAYRQLQSDVHPDRFAGDSDAAKRLAQQSSARVNEAYVALKDPVQRAQYLLRLHGIEAISETDTALPLAFLERQLERREQAADAQAAGDIPGLTALLADARAESAALEHMLGQLLDGEKAYAAARMQVRELTFLAKLADDIDAMLAAIDS
ncbi:MAG: Fe-S protein assembly co-chaperone HscB [Betaproteobacteria bacterium]